jgi:hypothetical protein
MHRTADDFSSGKRPELSSAGKDAFHSVLLFPWSDALGFHVLSCEPSSHLQEVRDAVECVPTRFMVRIRVQWVEVAPFHERR